MKLQLRSKGCSVTFINDIEVRYYADDALPLLSLQLLRRESLRRNDGHCDLHRCEQLGSANSYTRAVRMMQWRARSIELKNSGRGLLHKTWSFRDMKYELMNPFVSCPCTHSLNTQRTLTLRYS